MARIATPPLLEDAACRRPGVDPLWFFPHRGEDGARAKQVCADCPELAPCRLYGLSDSRLIGVWGGLNGHERRQIIYRRPGVRCEDRQPMSTDELELDQSAIVVSNGHTPEPERLCEQCRKRAARPSSPTCANPECVAGHRRQRRRANYRTGNTPVAVTAKTANRNGPAGRQLWELVAEAGPALLSVTFQFQDEPWVLTRATNGRNP
jgi:WhiB family redox-sensing transcriptional regulator